MNGACEPIGRQPFCDGVRLEERAIDLLWIGCQNAVQTNNIWHGELLRVCGLNRIPCATSMIGCRRRFLAPAVIATPSTVNGIAGSSPAQRGGGELRRQLPRERGSIHYHRQSRKH